MHKQHDNCPRHSTPYAFSQQFDATAPDKKWCSDITYIPTDEGWLFLAVTLDLYSRNAQLVCSAYQMALAQRKPAPGLIHHSNRGPQYTSYDFQNLMTTSKAQAIMSAKGNCNDNAVSESFFATLKTERVPDNGYEKRSIGKGDIFTYIEGFYNRKRLHFSIGYHSPEEYKTIYWENQSNGMTSSQVH